MTNESDRLYAFTFRALLTEQALDSAGRKKHSHRGELEEGVAHTLSINLLDNTLVAEARTMATVYTAIAAFENSVRKLIKMVLLEQKGEDWWQT
jgi:hypothetical protein